MLRTTTVLPQGFVEIAKIDLAQNKKEALIVNGLALAIGIVMIVVGMIGVPIMTLFAMTNLGEYILKLVTLLLGMLAYIVLHEMVHGVFMYRFSHVKPTFGFKGLYAYAGSTAYFNRRDYLIIALSPIVLWGIVLAVITAIAPVGWFWPVYAVQIVNISGAAGDLYVAWRFRKFPQDILTLDSGTDMIVYAAATNERCDNK